jgi:hypothetical protein
MNKARNFKGMGKILLVSFLMVFMVTAISGCNSGATDKTTTKQATSETAKVSKTNPLVVDKATKTVKIYAEVNGKYFVEPTRHGVVFMEGSNCNKSILKAYSNQIDFYNAMIELGAAPGNNVTLETKKAVVEGSPLDVTVSWEGLGKEIPFRDIYIDSTNKPLDVRFGGNLDRSKAKQTGCILCLDTCPVGITSNASHPQGSFDGKLVEFKGNKDVLPADGTGVIVSFKLKNS